MVDLDDIESLVYALVSGLEININSENSKRLVSQAGSGDRILVKTGSTISSNSYTKDRKVQYILDLDFETQENLDLAIDQIIEKIDEFKVSRIIEAAETFSIEVYTDDISRNVDDESGTVKDGDHGRIATDTGDNWYTISRFVNKGNRVKQGETLTAATLRITAHNSKATKEIDLRIIGYKGGSIPDPTSTLIAAWITGNTTKTYNINNPNLPTNWTAGTEYSLTTSDSDSILEILQEIVDDAGFDGDFGLYFSAAPGFTALLQIYTVDSGDSNDGKYMELDITYQFIDEDIFDIQLISAPSSKEGSRFKAQVVLEINQSVT